MNWKKGIIIALDIVIGVYLVLAVTAFNKPEERSSVCNEVRISIEKTDPQGFLNEEDIRQILVSSHLMPLGKPMDKISVRQIEEKLSGNNLIESAQCYKTQSGHVCISLRQRVPVVRVMADNGDDYYVDNHGESISPSGYSCDVIVATGSISRAYAKKHLFAVANDIQADQFWKNQVVQLNILADGSVELIPRVGEHIAYLGQPTDISHKLQRLQKFYLYGLSQAGWNKYSRISVEFDNQIICKRTK